MVDWLNNHLSQAISPSLSSKSAAINLPSRKDSLDTNLEDLANTVDAFEMLDTTDVGRMTSPLFSQKREESAIPFSEPCGMWIRFQALGTIFKFRETVLER